MTADVIQMLIVLSYIFGAFAVVVYLVEDPRWYRRLPSSESRSLVATSMLLLAPLMLVAAVLCGTYLAARGGAKGTRDLYRHVFPRKVQIPEARARRAS